MVEIAVIALVVILFVVSAALLARDTIFVSTRIRDIEKRLENVEAACRQRLPYKSFDELLNAMAALDKEIEERKFQTSLLENAAGHIANAMKVGTKREAREA